MIPINDIQIACLNALFEAGDIITLKDELTILIQDRNPTDFAKKCKIRVSTLYKHLQSKEPDIPVHLLLKILTALGLRLSLKEKL